MENGTPNIVTGKACTHPLKRALFNKQSKIKTNMATTVKNIMNGPKLGLSL